MVPVLGGAEHPETPPMTRPAVVRSLILGCAGELDAVTFAGVVATARIRPSVCQYSAIMSWARDNHGARIAVVLRVKWLYAASESCAQISLYVVGSRPSRAVPHVARSPERITGQVNRD